MKLFLLLLLSTFTLQEDLIVLDKTLQESAQYEQRHRQEIDSLQRLQAGGDQSFGTCLELFELYASYQFDSAYHYVCQLEQIAKEADNREKIKGNNEKTQEADKMALAAIKKSFTYFSAGLFKEAYDILECIDIEDCAREVQVDYYSSFARLCFDLGTYADGIFYEQYTKRAIALLDKEIALLTPSDTSEYHYAIAMQQMKQGDYTHALRSFEDCMTDTSVSEHDRAIILSSMAYPASMLGDKDLALHYMIEAAISDLHASVNEGVALRFVATMLNERGMTDEAMRYIQYAQENAIRYGARHRQMEVSQILPIIEQSYLTRLQERNRRIYALSACSLILLVICVIGLMLYSKRNRALAEARQTIEGMNDNLLVANKIKEEYIGSFLCWQSSFINEMEQYQRHIRRAGQLRKFDEMTLTPDHADATRYREDFYRRFDEMFLHIFPHFVSDFNALLRENERIQLRQGELLNTDLRIFALIRLGITQNEMIATVLNYSINTIYAYKTRIKAKSDLSNEAFYEAVQRIN